MKVLLTGASSFSGLWIAKALHESGHEIVAPLKQEKEAYGSIRRMRVDILQSISDVYFATPWQSLRFKELLITEKFDAFLHHGADIKNYNDQNYDIMNSINLNAAGFSELIQIFSKNRGRYFISTGSIFESQKYDDMNVDLAVTPYGLAKSLTNLIFQHLSIWSGLSFGRVVVSAPFGPYEESRFSWSLVNAWLDGNVGIVRTPKYVRDNIPAPLLGLAYAKFLQSITLKPMGAYITRPMGFVGTQSSFARRLAEELGPRLGLECRIFENDQFSFDQPKSILNTDLSIPQDWNKTRFWDSYADYYLKIRHEENKS